MLRVGSDKPCKLVYAICKHEYLGYLIEPHIVQLNADGGFSLTYQRLFSNTAAEFSAFLDETDFKLIKLLEEVEQDAIIKRYYKKIIRPLEFFSKVWDDKMQEAIRPKIEKKLDEALKILPLKPIFLMGKEGWPVEKEVKIASEPASVLFHFRRNNDETRYFPTIKYQGNRIEFMFKDALILMNHPAWMLLDDTLYFFDKDVEGKKLLPFLNKRFISIPKTSEKTYFEKFVSPLIEKHAVYAEGFTINTEKYDAVPVLKLIYISGGISQLQVFFKYHDYLFPSGNERSVSVKMENDGDDYIFHRIKRSQKWEQGKLEELFSLGLKPNSSLFNNFEVDDKHVVDEANKPLAVFDWINEHHDYLSQLGFTFEQSEGNKKYVIGSSKIDLEISEQNDWFDIHAIVYFGNYQIPFIELKNHILNRTREFVLPNGEIAIIPEKWFAQFGSLLNFAEGKDQLKLKKMHVGLVYDFANSEIASLAMDRKLKQLADFEKIDDEENPQNFNGILRPYQKAGYNWFQFLRKYNFGGCLADDMGLGKTIQTLALLQKTKETHLLLGHRVTSLIVMPTSLIYNWINEAKKFTPNLKIYTHTGTFREKMWKFLVVTMW